VDYVIVLLYLMKLRRKRCAPFVGMIKSMCKGLVGKLDGKKLTQNMYT